MALTPDFPKNPYVILDPEIRWYPGDDNYSKDGYATLIPPLVYRIRQGVQQWRDRNYAGASETTRALLTYWFQTDHYPPFNYYFAQREAVESAIWLYEIEQAHDPYALLKYDASGRVAAGMFPEDWTRYVMKLATGAGKTKIISLLIAWAYFHKRYEPASDLSTNFLVIAPNIIVLDRLRTDFDGLKIFYDDPILPPNGYQGQNWEDDFQINLHIQDQIGIVADTGNLFLTNIHRVFLNQSTLNLEDDFLDYCAGDRPTKKTNESNLDLGQIIRSVGDLVILNDEAHHIHDEKMAWFKNIQEISQGLRLKGSKLSAQFDLTATPKHTNGSIFVQTISDYPLVEAIRQGVTKTPVLPDPASRAKLTEKQTKDYCDQYRDYLNLGYLEWHKVYQELQPIGKKAVLFIMTDDTKNCDRVKEFLEANYPDLQGGVLVIHTKQNGDIAEAATGKNKEELDKLRKLSKEIDRPDNPYKVIVSVMVLREGWDVQNVVSIVGLRPYKAKSNILPEQTLGRGLRRMFRGQNIQEKVSVIGTEKFMEFVESIKAEGIELEYAPMGGNSQPKSPIVVEVDRKNPQKDIPELDIELPELTPRLQREYKNLESLDVSSLPPPKLPVTQFSEQEQRQIIFRDLDTGEISHRTNLDSGHAPNYQNTVGFFARNILRDLRLVQGFDILFGKVKDFIENQLFEVPVQVSDRNILRNLSEPEAMRGINETFKTAINQLTIQDQGTTEVVNYIKLSQTRPYLVNESSSNYLIPEKSIFNKVTTDNQFELAVATFLNRCPDIISFTKNSLTTRFPRIEYQTANSGIANYYPDFVVQVTKAEIWIIETKGREDIQDVLKWSRLVQWCADATKQSPQVKYQALYLPEEDWDRYQLKPSFQALVKAFQTCHPQGSGN